MQVRFGNHTHPLNEAAVQIEREPMLSEAGIQYGSKETWTISGLAQAATQAELYAALAALEAAYSKWGGDLVLLNNSGTVCRRLAGVTVLGNTRAVGGVSYPEDGRGTAEGGTYRTYQVRVEGYVPYLSGNVILSWVETLSFEGGGPRFVYLQPLNGLPQRQQTAEFTPFRASQEGAAVGLYTWPPLPGPLWPADWHQDTRRETRKLPKRRGNSYVEYEVNWSYQFESGVPLLGNPTPWPA